MGYRRKDCFVKKIVDGDSVVIARGKEAINFNAIIVLNESGGILWDALSDYRSSEELSNLLVEKYGIPQDVALRDV